MLFTKMLLSGSTNGKQIKVAATGSPGTLIHTAVTGTTNLDEIYLFASQASGGLVTLTIQWGGTASPDDELNMDIESDKGDYVVIAGKVLQNGLVVRAFASSPDVVLISGYVHRLTP